MKLHILALLALLASPATAGDWYVDGAAGSNSNSGTSPADAWRTITYAVQQLSAGAGADTIHVLPGTYDPAHGEVFPFVPRTGLTFLGEQGPEHTILRGASDMFRMNASTGSVTLTVRGFTVRNTGLMFRVQSPNPFQGGCLRLVVRDALIENCNTVVNWNTYTVGAFCHTLDMDDVVVRDCVTGIRIDNAEANDVDVTLVDCSFLDLNDTALILTVGIESIDVVTLRRCTIDQCANGVVVDSSSSGSYGLFIEDSAITRCMRGVASGADQVRVTGSTLAGNTVAGMDSSDALIERSIVYGNAQDLSVLGSYTANFSDIGTGPHSGTGNVSVDPLYRDPARGDFRLGFTTACVDALPGATGVDLTGFARGNDGDLDLVGAGDMGAYELRTLSAPATIGIGQKLHLEVHAEPGAYTALWLARSQQLAMPDPTPFGNRWLPAALLELVATRKVLTPDPVRHTVYVPVDPSLIGQPFSFQALSRSTAAPAGAAWTDAVTVVVTP